MIIFTNQRAIRNFKFQFKNRDIKVKNLISITEFNKKAIYIDGFKSINSLERELIFNLTVKELKDENRFGEINNDILNFLSYSTHFFSFFKELADEGISINTILEADYFEDYQKNITVLKTIYYEYRKKMMEMRYIDDIFIPLDYRLNIPYIKSVGEIEYRFQGQLSNFQVKLFKEIAKYIPVSLLFIRSRFNKKIDKQINLELEPDKEYLLDFGKDKLILKKDIQLNNEIRIFSFRNRFTQIGFVKEKIWYFYEKLGVPLDEIGVILLDENFAKLLKPFNRNLNFAMGLSIQEHSFFKFVNSIYLYIENSESEEHQIRKNRYVGENTELKNILKLFLNSKTTDKNIFIEIIIKIIKEFNINRSLTLKILDVLNLFRAENIDNLNLKTLLKMFVSEIRGLTIDDIHGGKVTVQGLLETRGSNYKAVIVLDFNDEIFPKQEEKDSFINSDIRKNVKLPLIQDREALQKLYLESLLQKAKYGAISFVDNDHLKISRFFYDFNFEIEKYSENYEKNLIKIVIPKGKNFSHWNNKNVIHKHTFSDKPLSNSQFKSFQGCPRRFYISNILKIKEHSVEQNIKLAIGNHLHNVLEKVYTDKLSFKRSSELYSLLEIELKKGSNIQNIYLSSWLQRLKLFAENESKRFKTGIQIYALEKKIDIPNYRGFQLTGKIDRVDKLPNGDLILIDYKLNKVSEFSNYFNNEAFETDFQLIFYYILMKEIGEKVNIDQLYYYSLKTGKMVKNKRTVEEFNLHLDRLKELEKKPISFNKNSKCDNFCGYKIICGN